MVERAVNSDKFKVGIIAMSEGNHYMIVGLVGKNKLKCMQVAYGDEGEILHQGRIEVLSVNSLTVKDNQVVDGFNVNSQDIEEILGVAARIVLLKTSKKI